VLYATGLGRRDEDSGGQGLDEGSMEVEEQGRTCRRKLLENDLPGNCAFVLKRRFQRLLIYLLFFYLAYSPTSKV